MPAQTASAGSQLADRTGELQIHKHAMLMHGKCRRLNTLGTSGSRWQMVLAKGQNLLNPASLHHRGGAVRLKSRLMLLPLNPKYLEQLPVLRHGGVRGRGLPQEGYFASQESAERSRFNDSRWDGKCSRSAYTCIVIWPTTSQECRSAAWSRISCRRLSRSA